MGCIYIHCNVCTKEPGTVSILLPREALCETPIHVSSFLSTFMQQLFVCSFTKRQRMCVDEVIDCYVCTRHPGTPVRSNIRGCQHATLRRLLPGRETFGPATVRGCASASAAGPVGQPVLVKASAGCCPSRRRPGLCRRRFRTLNSPAAAALPGPGPVK